MSELDKAKEAAYAKYLKDPARKAGDTWPFTAGFDAGLATATAKIEALEAKLAAAEKSNEWLRQCLAEIRTFALDGGHWAIGNACDDALATGAGSLEALEKENADA